jgi:multidrug efflux pump subunit AcrA (membrane-fusion protein)
MKCEVRRSKCETAAGRGNRREEALTLFGLLTLAALCLLAAGCRKSAPAGFAPPPARVSVAEAVAEDVPVYLDEIGQGTAFESVTVTPQVSGQISSATSRMVRS